MAMNLNPAKINELKGFVAALRSQPQLVHHPELGFLRDYLASLGATLPEREETKPAEAAAPPKKEAQKEPEAEEEPEPEPMDEQEEEDPELMIPDELSGGEMGDESKEVSDDDMSRANDLKNEALAAQRDANYEEAIRLFTEAVKANPHSGIIYASRAACYLQMKKPNAAIRDTEVAIKANPDSAKPYKVRGKAYRHLGKYEEALKDLQLGNKLDWDESSYELQKFVQARVTKRNEIRKKKEEREKLRKEREKAKKSSSAAGSSSGAGSSGFPGMGGMPGMGGFPGMGGMPGMGGFPGMGGMPGMGGAGMPNIDPALINTLLSDPELMQALQNPAVMAKVQQVMQDPSKMAQFKDDPQLASLFAKFQKFQPK